MAAKKTYLIAGHPYYIDNVKDKWCIVNHATGEVVAEEGKDFTRTKLNDWCERLNIAWSDGYRISDLIHKKKGEKNA